MIMKDNASNWIQWNEVDVVAVIPLAILKVLFLI